jgi:cell division protein FtsB
MNDKDRILDEVDSLIAPQKKLGLRFLVKMLLVFFIVWLLLFPKIFLQSQIYYKSRDIAVQSREYEALKEENRIIKAKVESIRFKYQVLDTLFD